MAHPPRILLTTLTAGAAVGEKHVCQLRAGDLHLIAANIAADATVLEYPDQATVERELAKGYDIVYLTTQRANDAALTSMARMLRHQAPSATLVLGGPSAAQAAVDADHRCPEPTIPALCELFGLHADEPISHPVIPAYRPTAAYGVPLPGPAASWFSPRLAAADTDCASTFELACQIVDNRGCETLYTTEWQCLRSELTTLMAHTDRALCFEIETANVGMQLTPDELVSLGVTTIWLTGKQESAQVLLYRELRRRGISVVEQHETVEATLLEVIEACWWGLKRLSALTSRGSLLDTRRAQLRSRTLALAPFLPVIQRLSPDPAERKRAAELDQALARYLGPWDVVQQATRLGAVAMARAWRARAALGRRRVQPRLYRTHYPAPRNLHATGPTPLIAALEGERAWV